MRKPCIALLIVAAVVATASFAQEGGPAPAPPAFRDSIDVNAVTVYVSVRGSDGHPVHGLDASAFSVTEAEQPLRIIDVEETGGAATAAAAGDRQAHLVLLVDNSKLQKRSRKKVLDSVASLSRTAAGNGTKLSVLVLGEKLDTLLPFTGDPAAVTGSFEVVEETETLGDRLASGKRALKREIQEVDLNRDMRPAFTTIQTTVTAGDQHVSVYGQQFLQRVNGLRQQETQNAQYALFQVQQVLRSLSGLAGRKDLLWITEDLEISPALDVYQVFYGKFSRWAQDLGLQHSEVWAKEINLGQPLAELSYVANASGTVLHIVDLADRDRQAADMNMNVTDKSMFATGTTAGERAAAGYDLAGAGSMVGGFRDLALSTGGSFYSGSGDFEGHLGELGERLVSGYAITYQRPDAADGQMHPVQVAAVRDDLVLSAPTAVGNRTLLQILADKTMSRLMLGLGEDPMGLRIRLGAAEAAEGGKSVRAIHVEIPTRSLELEAREDAHVGSVVLVFQSMDANGSVLPPQVLQQPISVPAERYSESGMVRASARLMMAADTVRLAVGVFDQMSGTEATGVVDLGPAGD